MKKIFFFIPVLFGLILISCNKEDIKDEVDDCNIVSLSKNGSANCYIVSEIGKYKFKAVKGNSDESVGNVASAEVLWESFGTDVTPNVGDLIKNAEYLDGCIVFEIADTLMEGNAVIAAKDASNNILWSWHIWLTDQPGELVYNKNAGTMMDRNLGATGVTSDDEGVLGLLYQWGRKDPFLASSSIDSSIPASSTITWPSAVPSWSNTGTIEYAIAHPTTFISYNSDNYDWYYTGGPSTDQTRWRSSSDPKSVYDPCPPGWRVPDGDFWEKSALANTRYYEDNGGLSFWLSSSSQTWTWYPASGLRDYLYEGALEDVGQRGYYWSASAHPFYYYCASHMFFFINGDGIDPMRSNGRAMGFSVRCVVE